MSQTHGRYCDAVSLHRNRAEIEAISDAVLAAAERCGFSKASRFAIRLAFEEAITNAFHHGHANLPDEAVDVRYEVDENQVVMTVADKGPG